MKVARITNEKGHTFFTNVVDPELLGFLQGVRCLEFVDMRPEDFWRTPATVQSDEFFAPIIARSQPRITEE